MQEAPIVGVGHELTFAPGVRPESAKLLHLARTNGIWNVLQISNPRAAQLIELYFGTEANLIDLSWIAQVTTPAGVRYIIISGLKFLWQQLPAEIQEQLPLSKTQRLKITQTPRTRAKMSQTKMRNDAEDKAAEKENDQFEPEKQIWFFLKKYGLLGELESGCLPMPITPRQMKILRDFFEKGGPKPKESLLDRLTIAAAWIGVFTKMQFDGQDI